MTEEKTTEEKITKIKHENIFSALASFQGENPEIKRTKEFGKEGEKMHWWYAPLDEILKTVRPILALNGLSITWEEKGEGKIVCALYHERYSKEFEEDFIEVETTKPDGAREITRTNKEYEVGVLRSMPIKVKRDGDMKGVGSDSTYARRYTLCEVLGIASDEDLDVGFDEARGLKLEGFAFSKAKEGIQKAKTIDALMVSADFFDKDLKSIADGKVPSLGLKKEQYEELLKLLGERKVEIEKSLVGKKKAGENDDAGGQAALTE